MKVVIIKLGALGDVIMSTPIIKSLQEEHKNDDVFLLTSPQYAELFKQWPGLSVAHFPRKGLRASIDMVLWLRRQGFDRIYDLQSNDRSRLLCILSGTKEKVGNHSLYPYSHHPGDCYTGQSHIFDRHVQLLASVGITTVDAKPSLPVSSEAEDRVKQWLLSHALDSNGLVLIHAGASPLHPKKRWPHFSGLAKLLTRSGYNIVWLGAEDDAELNTELARRHGVDATNAFSVIELVALGKKAMLAITNDSGPMHVLACAEELPVCALFGPTDWRRNHAIGQKENVISLNKSNALWRAEDYADTDRNLLGSITVEMVWSFLLKGSYIRQ